MDLGTPFLHVFKYLNAILWLHFFMYLVFDECGEYQIVNDPKFYSTHIFQVGLRHLEFDVSGRRRPTKLGMNYLTGRVGRGEW